MDYRDILQKTLEYIGQTIQLSKNWDKKDNCLKNDEYLHGKYNTAVAIENYIFALINGEEPND